MAEPDGLIRLALFGSPVRRSLSPRIHQLFAAQAGIAIEYRAIESSVEELPEQLDRLVSSGARGCNITAPLKHLACELATRLSSRAETAGAVNTLCFERADDWYGDNTDGTGLLRDLRNNLGLAIQHRRVLVIGAGGAAAGILYDLLEQQPERLVLANRTPQRAFDLAARMAHVGPIEAATFDDMAQAGPFDLVLNATSAGHVRALPPVSASLFADDAFCYDLNYGIAHAVLADWCDEQDIRHHGGLGMLVEQAAESFRLWTGCLPDTGPVIEALAEPADG